MSLASTDILLPFQIGWLYIPGSLFLCLFIWHMVTSSLFSSIEGPRLNKCLQNSVCAPNFPFLVQLQDVFSVEVTFCQVSFAFPRTPIFIAFVTQGKLSLTIGRQKSPVEQYSQHRINHLARQKCSLLNSECVYLSSRMKLKFLSFHPQPLSSGHSFWSPCLTPTNMMLLQRSSKPGPEK